MDSLGTEDKQQHEENYKARISQWYQNPPKDLPDMMKFYDQWADTYDTETASIQYSAPTHAARYFHQHASQLGLTSTALILDVAAGTGRVGIELKKLGYANVDGEEPCAAMFQRARDRHVYRKYFDFAVGEHPMPIDDGSYDGVVVAGALPHIGEKGLQDMIRVLKAGGVFVCADKVVNVEKDARWLPKSFHRLEREGIVRKLELDIPPEYYYLQDTAMVFVYQKL